jgi:hypothetical protein
VTKQDFTAYCAEQDRADIEREQFEKEQARQRFYDLRGYLPQ